MGCVDEEILPSICGLSPHTPRSASPTKSPPPPTNATPPPPNPPSPKSPASTSAKSFESSSNSSLDQALPCAHGKDVKGMQPQQQKRCEEPPSLEGDDSPDPLLVAHFFVPYTEGVHPGVVTSVVGGGGAGGGASVGGTPRGKGDVSG